MSNGFPNNPNNLDRASGNEKKYIYNNEDDTWKNFGGATSYPLVSRENDGLIYPDLYDRLEQIKNESKNLNNLKLTENKSYFYNFISTDRLIKFTIYNNNFIIELDKGAITRRLATIPCVGPRGPRGLKGKTGRDGVPAANERFRPVYQDGSFEVDVSTPTDQPISLRGYKFNSQEFEALLYLDGTVEDENDGIKTNDDGSKEIELIGDPKLGKVTVKATLSDPNLRFKIRQRGAQGANGKNGVNYVEAITEDVKSNGRFTEVVGMLRFNKALNSLIFKKTSVNALLNNVTNLIPSPNLPTNDYWAAAEITSDLRKDVEYHQFEPALEAPPLDLPSYVPLSGCYNQRRYSLGYLDSPENTPFTFVTDLFPDYKSCKDPYWFCGNNAGDGLCTGSVDVNPTRLNAPFETSSTSSSSESTISDSSDSSESESESSSDSSESESESSSDSSDSSESESESSSDISEVSYSESTMSENNDSSDSSIGGLSNSSISDSSISDSSDSSISDSSISDSSISDSSISDSSISDSSISNDDSSDSSNSSDDSSDSSNSSDDGSDSSSDSSDSSNSSDDSSDSSIGGLSNSSVSSISDSSNSSISSTSNSSISSTSNSSDSSVSSDSSDSSISSTSNSSDSSVSSVSSVSSDSSDSSISSVSSISDLSSDSSVINSSDSSVSQSSDTTDLSSLSSPNVLSSSSSDDPSSLSSGECLETAALTGTCSKYVPGEYKVIAGTPTITFDMGYGYFLVFEHDGANWVVTSNPNGCYGPYPCNDIYIYNESSDDLFCSGSGPTVLIEFYDYSYSCSGVVNVPY